jgi:hypothetical protein
MGLLISKEMNAPPKPITAAKPSKVEGDWLGDAAWDPDRL